MYFYLFLTQGSGTCLRRFIARRGNPFKILSVNATNYVGARISIELNKFLNANKRAFKEKLVKDDITWSFISSYSPHRGGLSKAGVKSYKKLLCKVIRNYVFTLEKLCTVLTQNETILTFRLLVPLSNDPNDLDP